MTISPRVLSGNWNAGYALDIHTVSSTYLGDNEYGHPQYVTKRSEIGELLYRLKYNSDESALGPIVETVVEFLRKEKWPIDIVVPVPPSRARRFQPVLALSKGIANSLRVELCGDCVVKVKDTPELKNVYEFDKRLQLLENAFDASHAKLKSRTVLLFDDLYRSGATLRSVGGVIREKGKARAVYALTLTTSRSTR